MKSTILTLSLFFAFSIFGGCKSNPVQTKQVDTVTTNSNLIFMTTCGTYPETANLDSAVKAELGTSYRIADWNDVIAYCSAHPVDSLISMINWNLKEPGNSSDTTREHFFVTWKGQGFWSQDLTRHFFATRFDHNVPSTWLVHDQIDNNHLVLGSWFGIKFNVLAVKPY